MYRRGVRGGFIGPTFLGYAIAAVIGSAFEPAQPWLVGVVTAFAVFRMLQQAMRMIGAAPPAATPDWYEAPPRSSMIYVALIDVLHCLVRIGAAVAYYLDTISFWPFVWISVGATLALIPLTVVPGVLVPSWREAANRNSEREERYRRMVR